MSENGLVCTGRGGKSKTSNRQRRVEMHFPRPEVRIYSRKQRPTTKQKSKERSRSPNTNKVTFFFRPSPLGFRQVDQHTSAWNELTATIGPWYNSLHGASMDPTVKAGVRTGYTVLDGSHNAEKQDTKRQKAKTEKANKPNNKQNPQSAKQALWTGPAQSEKSDGLCITAFFSVQCL